jgi:hypothetical protein
MSAATECTLGRFQDAFARVLMDVHGADDDPALRRLVSQPGFAVYRNTVMKGCIDALQANFPAVQRLVGAEWFQAAAAVYVRSKLPDQPSLIGYGEALPDFLERFEPAAELPYLPAVAQLDRWWTEAHMARDEAPLDARRIAGLEPAALTYCVLRPHASARWGFFDGPAVTIWRRNRYDAAVDLGDLVYRREGVLIVRPGAEVTNIDLDAAQCAFLDGCGAGENLARAAARALALDAACNLVHLMQRLLEAGAFAVIDSAQTDRQENAR